MSHAPLLPAPAVLSVASLVLAGAVLFPEVGSRFQSRSSPTSLASTALSQLGPGKALSRLTVVYEPSRPGCMSCWQTASRALRKFRSGYPEARVLVALPERQRAHPDLVASGEVVVASRPSGPRSSIMGWLVAFDGLGRQLLARALTGNAAEETTILQELEASYSLTRPLSESQAP